MFGKGRALLFLSSYMMQSEETKGKWIFTAQRTRFLQSTEYARIG